MCEGKERVCGWCICVCMRDRDRERGGERGGVEMEGGCEGSAGPAAAGRRPGAVRVRYLLSGGGAYFYV